MSNHNVKQTKRFLIPILLLVIVSIVIVVSINTYININMFKKHMDSDINKYKKEYLERQKDFVYKKVHLVNDSIKFQITKIEKKVKSSLTERIKTAMNIAQYIYEQQKGKFSNEQIKKNIAEHLSSIVFNEGRGYYFTYKYDNNVILGHALGKFVGKDMTDFKDIKGQNLVNLYKNGLKNNNISFSKIYFRKPTDPDTEYPKIVCVVKFKPLNIIIGTGEYLDDVENQIKKYVIDRFSNIKADNNRYLFFYKLHNINGGDDFATMILNQNRPDLIGKKINDSYKDAKGKEFRKEFLKDIRLKGESFTKYWYQKPGGKEIMPKMSYFYLQRDWNWIIANGFYYDDLYKEITKMEKMISKYTDDTINKAFVWIGLMSLLIILIAVYVSIKIDRTIKNYTDELVEKKMELEMAQEVAKMGSWSLDLITNKLRWSDKTYTIFDIKKEQFKGTYEEFLNKIHPEDKNIVNAAYQKSLEDKKPFSIVHRLIINDGTIKWVEEKCDTIFDKYGKPLVSNGTIQDITKEYNQQQNIKIQEKLLHEQEKLASMGEMIGNIAHQWRQPLSVISTSTSGMQIEKEMDTLSDEKFYKYTDGILKNTEFLSKTIDTFRNYIKEKKELKEVVLQDRIRSAVDIIEAAFINNHIKLINDIDRCEPINITMVVGELSQVIINLLNNAKDILLEQNIDDPTVKILLEKCDNNAVITIEDNGGGIPEDILPKIFDPYFTTKHQSQGTGLGLHMSKDIIEKHLNGRIYAQNNNNGATFTIIIPI